MHNILREKYFDMVSEGYENISSVLEFCSNWLRLITQCENITLFWSFGAGCIMPCLRQVRQTAYIHSLNNIVTTWVQCYDLRSSEPEQPSLDFYKAS